MADDLEYSRRYHFGIARNRSQLGTKVLAWPKPTAVALNLSVAAACPGSSCATG